MTDYIELLYSPLSLLLSKILCSRKCYLYPDSSSLLEQRDELSFDMKAHDLIGTTDEFLVDEHRREARPPPRCSSECLLQLLPVGQFIELINRGVCSEAAYQCLDGVGHAASALAEYHHRFVRRHPLDRVHDPVGNLVFAAESNVG